MTLLIILACIVSLPLLAFAGVHLILWLFNTFDKTFEELDDKGQH